VAGQQKKTAAVKDAKIHASVDIGPANEKNGFSIAVKILVENVSDHDLIQAAHEVGSPTNTILSSGANQPLHSSAPTAALFLKESKLKLDLSRLLKMSKALRGIRRDRFTDVLLQILFYRQVHRK